MRRKRTPPERRFKDGKQRCGLSRRAVTTTHHPPAATAAGGAVPGPLPADTGGSASVANLPTPAALPGQIGNPQPGLRILPHRPGPTREPLRHPPPPNRVRASLHRIGGRNYCRHHVTRAAAAAGIITPAHPIIDARRPGQQPTGRGKRCSYRWQVGLPDAPAGYRCIGRRFGEVGCPAPTGSRHRRGDRGESSHDPVAAITGTAGPPPRIRRTCSGRQSRWPASCAPAAPPRDRARRFPPVERAGRRDRCRR